MRPSGTVPPNASLGLFLHVKGTNVQRGKGFYFHSCLLDKTQNDLDGAILLCYVLANNHEACKLSDISVRTGLPQGRLKNARKLLSALRLVDENRAGNVISFSIIDPELIPENDTVNASTTEYEGIHCTSRGRTSTTDLTYTESDSESGQSAEDPENDSQKTRAICNYNYNNFSYYKYNRINSNVIGNSQLNTQSNNSTLSHNTSLITNYKLRQVDAKNLKSFDDILNGDLDEECREAIDSGKRWEPRGHLSVLLEGWARVFDKSYREGTRRKVNYKRIKAFNSALDDGYLPSDFAKAILGMSYDTWSDRHMYCDWDHVARAMPRWLKLYEDKQKPQIETKTIYVSRRRVIIPVDYVWESSDTHMLEQGYRLNFETRRWEK